MSEVCQGHLTTSDRNLPSWFRQELPDPEKTGRMKRLLRTLHLATVCESARCPNTGQCWGRGVATFQILGNICTRACRFCAVVSGRPRSVDPREPSSVAIAVEKLALRYVVITSVTRDDLADGGADQFVRTVSAVRARVPGVRIELLISDLAGEESSLRRIIGSRPDVIGHNVETVRRLSPAVRPQADYQRSLEILRRIKEAAPAILTKSGLMVGLGETDQEVEETMGDLLSAGCDMLTIGQYLAPTRSGRHLPVDRFVPPERFEEYRRMGLALGFRHVQSGPLVRSSFIAEQGYRSCRGEDDPNDLD